MTICQVPGCQQHFGCRMRAKGIQLSPRATTSRTQNWKPTPMVPPSRNGQIIYDERPGGAKVPFLHDDGSVVRQCDVDADPKRFASQVRRARTVDTTP